VSNNIEGKVVVITGASSGLGEATARHLSAQGAIVALGARRLDRLQALADELTERGGKALVVATDVADRVQVQRLVDAAVETYGRIDVLHEACGARSLRGTSAGGEALQYSHDGDLAGRRRHRAAEQRDRARYRRERSF
jgi:NADP-dependent 3-hydroxy acid dehydrogenase YdfG